MRNQPVPPRTTDEDRPRLYHLRRLLGDKTQRHRVLFLFGLLLLGFTFTLAFFSYRLPQLPFDLGATTRLQSIHATAFANFMVVVSLAGYLPWSPLVVLLGVIVVGYTLSWHDGAYLLLLTLFQGLANTAIKIAIHRPRPDEALVQVLRPNSGNSFPSGHVMLYTVFFGFLFFLSWTRLRGGWGRRLALLFFGLMVLLVGPSRIYLGAHWLSDVVAGHMVGLVILLFGIELYAHFVTKPATETSDQA